MKILERMGVVERGKQKPQAERDMRELATILKAASEENHVDIAEKLYESFRESPHDPDEELPSVVGLCKFCNHEPVNNERFAMSDARRVVEEVTSLWPSMKDVTMERVYALKQMMDAVGDARPAGASSKQIVYGSIKVIIAEGMYRIAQVEQEKPLDGLSSSEKKDLYLSVCAVANRVNPTTIRIVAPKPTAEQGEKMIRPLEEIGEPLRLIVEDVYMLVGGDRSAPD